MILKTLKLAIAGLALTTVPAMATVVGGGVVNGPNQAQFFKLHINSGGTFENSNGFDYGTNEVGRNDFDAPHLFAFDEGQNIFLTQEVVVNTGSNPQANGYVASHYVFFDPQASRSMEGYVDFDSPIFGIASETAQLNASDWLAPTNIFYDSPNLRGLENGDVAYIDPTNPNRLIFDVSASSPGDYVRVFTQFSPAAAVPLPAGLPLLAAALGGLVLTRRRKS